VSKNENNPMELELYRVVRAEIEHEDQLINHRLSWLVSSQSFLLTGFAVSLNAPIPMRTPEFERVNHILFNVLPYAGLAMVAFIYPTILGAMLAMGRLRRHVRGRKPHGFPPVQVSNFTLFLGHLGPVFVPWVFIAAWLIVIRLPRG
jgi:hypothetical protein